MKSLKSLFILFVLASFCGCKIFRASPAKPSGFLAHDNLLAEMERSPFNAGYVPDRKRLDDLKKVYKRVCLTPVELNALRAKLKMDDLSKSEIDDRLSDAQELVEYLQGRYQLEFEKQGIEVSFEPREDCFIWELAIVELRPTLVALNVAATAAGTLIPGAGVIQRFGSGSIAIEGIIRDGKTGDILAEFKDRQADKTAPFTIKDFQKYSHARNTIDEWTESFAKLTTTTGDVKIDRPFPLTLLPF
jgi:hypothetical protein